MRSAFRVQTLSSIDHFSWAVFCYKKKFLIIEGAIFIIIMVKRIPEDLQGRQHQSIRSTEVLGIWMPSWIVPYPPDWPQRPNNIVVRSAFHWIDWPTHRLPVWDESTATLAVSDDLPRKPVVDKHVATQHWHLLFMVRSTQVRERSQGELAQFLFFDCCDSSFD